MKLTMEPGGIGEDGVFHEARMIVQVEAPTQTTADPTAAAPKAAVAARQLSPRKPSFTHRADPATSAGAGVAGRPTSAPMISPRSSSGAIPVPPLGTPRKLSAAHSERISPQNSAAEGLPRRAASFPTAAGAGASSLAAGRAATPSPSPPLSARSRRSDEYPPLPPPPPSGLPPIGKPPKGKGFASRFMNRLSNRKERFQGKEPAHWHPARDEDDMTGNVKQNRSLASKLLSRKGSKRGNMTMEGGGGLDRLAFGGHELSDIARKGSMMSNSVDEDASARHSGSVDGSEFDDYNGLEAVMEGGSDQVRDSDEAVEEHHEGDGSLASEDEDEDYDGASRNGRSSVVSGDTPLTQEALQQASSSSFHHRESSGGWGGTGISSSGRDSSWHRGPDFGPGADAMSVLDDGTSSVIEYGGGEDDATEAAAAAAAGMAKIPKGVYVMGRLTGFELVGERGTKVPNLTIGNADVRATVFARFVFEYSKHAGWRAGTQPGDRPVFHVDKLKYTIRGNNVPMPQALIKHILRMAIPGLIQRRLLALMPKEFGEYLMNAKKGLDVTADVGVVGPALAVLDADLGFEVRGPAKSAKDARKQQALYAAAKEARNLLGLSLPQAQVLAELFNGGAALLDPPRPASIANLIAFQATYERFPKVFKQLCQVLDTAYHVLAQAQGRPEVADFSFSDFIAGPVRRMRRKPARTRVVVRSMDVAVNADAMVTAIHDFTQRAIEELIVKGPLLEPGATLQTMKDTVSDELEVLHAWHAFALRELQHFKSKFKGAAGTVLAAADYTGFYGGIENCFYEGPLRLRLPLNIQLDQDGAFSFELPLPAPEGKLGVVRQFTFIFILIVMQLVLGISRYSRIYSHL